MGDVSVAPFSLLLYALQRPSMVSWRSGDNVDPRSSCKRSLGFRRRQRQRVQPQSELQRRSGREFLALLAPPSLSRTLVLQSRRCFRLLPRTSGMAAVSAVPTASSAIAPCAQRVAMTAADTDIQIFVFSRLLAHNTEYAFPHMLDQVLMLYSPPTITSSSQVLALEDMSLGVLNAIPDPASPSFSCGYDDLLRVCSCMIRAAKAWCNYNDMDDDFIGGEIVSDLMETVYPPLGSALEVYLCVQFAVGRLSQLRLLPENVEIITQIAALAAQLRDNE